MAAKKKSGKKTESLMDELEDTTRLPGVEEIGADAPGVGSLESNAQRPLRLTAFETPRTADDIPALTDKVAETRKKAEASRIREIRSRNKLLVHIQQMQRIQAGETNPLFTQPDSSQIKVMNSKISLSRLNFQVDKPTIDETQKVADVQLTLNARKRFGERASHAEIADALNTKSYLKKRVIDPDTGKKVPVAPHTEDSVADALARRAMAQGDRPSSSIEDRLRSLNQQVSREHRATVMDHLVARSHLDEAKGNLESIQEAAAAARAGAASREAERNAPETDAATGLEYGSKNTIARGKSKTDPAVEVIGKDFRKQKEISLSDADFAQLTRAVAPIRKVIQQGGGNIKFPTHTLNKTGGLTEIPASGKTPISGGAVDAHLESIRTSHTGAVRVGPRISDALAHIRDAHETLLTIKALVPQKSTIRTDDGEIDFHKTLDSAITAHETAHRAIVRRVVQRSKTIKSTLPSLTDVKKRVGAVVQTIKTGRKVYDISEATGSAVTGTAGQRLAQIAGIGVTQADETGNIAPESRDSVLEYNRNRAPEQGNRTTSPRQRQINSDIAAYAKTGRVVPAKEREATKPKDFTNVADEDVMVQTPFSEAARAELSNRKLKAPVKKSRTTPFKEGNGTA